jgi:crotonobetainyl-CoA:carnitine CoA-transferase CaiB-like acyl-CoA transferase
MMAVHGREHGRPRRIGGDIASFSAGVLAVQGILASLLAQERGLSCDAETSVLQAGLALVSHNIAFATHAEAGDAPPSIPGQGPPFSTADGHWLEIETFEPDVWIRFWAALGVESRVIGRTWRTFAVRYNSAICPMPQQLHAAIAARTLAELTVIAEQTGMSLCCVKDYEEVLHLLATAGRSRLPWKIRSGEPVGEGRKPSIPGATHQAKPLSGLKVLEATRAVQGPYTGLLLSLLGAEVTRVDPPGSELYLQAPPWQVGAFPLTYDRGKKGIQLDLKNRAGREALLELAAESDVFLHNWKADLVPKFGLEFEDLARCNPRIVYAHASGWGEFSAAMPKLATDCLVQAHSGLGGRLSMDGEQAFPSRIVFADVFGALLSCEAILAGLYLRERTGGTGCRVDTSLFGAALELHTQLGGGHGFYQDCPSSRRPQWSCLDRPLETAEGYLTLTACEEETLRRVAGLCGVSDAQRSRAEVEHAITERLLARAARHWEEMFLAEEIPCAVVHADVTALPQDARLSPLFEQTRSAWVPAAPWRFTSAAS